MKRKIVIAVLALLVLALVPTVALANDVKAEVVKSFDFAGPLFGLAAAPDGSLLVADGGAGIVELRHDSTHLVSELPGVTDIAPIGRGVMFAITGGGGEEESRDPSARTLYRVSRGSARQIADLGAFEENNNPDGGVVDSNPFDVAALSGGTALVADAGGNDLLLIDQKGNVDWIATFPMELASTANAKALAGCPTPPPGFEFICSLPDAIPAEPVSTSVAVGPDGAYYVGELKGFPGPTGMSKVWRIEPGTLHAECGTSPACSVVYDDFTSVIDLAFGPDGTLYVVEMDEAGWIAVELGAMGLPGAVGGTVNACDAHGGGCSVVAGGLFMTTAVAVDKKGGLYATTNALIPGAATVVPLP